jgi:hypothetical protein
MWGFEILAKSSSIADANRHFAIALQSKRRREYVRHMQISALLWVRDPEQENEAIRVANEIRSKGETMPAGIPERSDTWRLWNIYYSRLINSDDKAQFLSALSPADHLATFRWLYPADRFERQAPPLPLHSASVAGVAPTRWPHSASSKELGRSAVRG